MARKLPPGWTRSNSRKIERKVWKSPYVSVEVWLNAHDEKTFCAGTYVSGSMETKDYIELSRTKLGFPRQIDAIRWANKLVPALRVFLKGMTK